MDILYISCYPDEYFKKIINESNRLSSQPAQKFNKLFVSGFKQNDVNIYVLLTDNHLNWDNNKILVQEESIIEDDIEYHFLRLLKIKYLNRIYMNFVVKRFLRRWKQEHPNGVIIMDFLKPFSNLICKYGKGMEIVTIVTDLPSLLLNDSGIIRKFKNKIILRSYRKTIKNSTHYVFLTEQMNTRLNEDKKPYCIIEGLVDINMQEQNIIIGNDKRKICLYSGALNRIYGLANLVEAFTDRRLEKYELHLYGTGDYVPELEQIIKKHNNIKYFGNVENSIVVKKQIEATVLINPRPTDMEYTHYSFPSKNLEYMVSGTPMITTDLPGMPYEYKNYVYIMNDYSVTGIIKIIDEILSKSASELKQKGESARSFVLKEKNNIVQAKKILDMLRN